MQDHGGTVETDKIKDDRVLERRMSRKNIAESRKSLDVLKRLGKAMGTREQLEVSPATEPEFYMRVMWPRKAGTGTHQIKPHYAPRMVNEIGKRGPIAHMRYDGGLTSRRESTGLNGWPVFDWPYLVAVRAYRDLGSCGCGEGQRSVSLCNVRRRWSMRKKEPLIRR